MGGGGRAAREDDTAGVSGCVTFPCDLCEARRPGPREGGSRGPFRTHGPDGLGCRPRPGLRCELQAAGLWTKQKDIVQVSMAVDTLNKRLGKLENNFSELEDDVEELSLKTQDFMQNTLRLLTGHDGEDLL